MLPILILFVPNGITYHVRSVLKELILAQLVFAFRSVIIVEPGIPMMGIAWLVIRVTHLIMGNVLNRKWINFHLLTLAAKVGIGNIKFVFNVHKDGYSTQKVAVSQYPMIASTMILQGIALSAIKDMILKMENVSFQKII